MKTIKYIIITALLMQGVCVYTQTETNSLFIRVFSESRKKIAKGKIVFMNDSILCLKRGQKKQNIQVKDIWRIKTKRSEGNSVLASTATGATIGIVLGVATADPSDWWGYTAGEGAIAFGSLGAIGGAAIGGISSAFKNSETYVINGDIDKWRLFKEMIEKVKYK
ncbi:hypothetical protein [Algibacter luteus]|jgi:hypothetical protein|uniref:Uncharacterized protein n=1 Tax=Algibacter luteus TaxID=1178825 RepID=A0A1M6G700_9FLAO|nr:hypothetical protein [Algibacter luteus]SHJ05712.1 hypothetical protein SAMN05216261_2641 [Algibacter luteus]